MTITSPTIGPNHQQGRSFGLLGQLHEGRATDSRVRVPSAQLDAWQSVGTVYGPQITGDREDRLRDPKPFPRTELRSGSPDQAADPQPVPDQRHPVPEHGNPALDEDRGLCAGPHALPPTPGLAPRPATAGASRWPSMVGSPVPQKRPLTALSPSHECWSTPHTRQRSCVTSRLNAPPGNPPVGETWGSAAGAGEQRFLH